jgi:hypothetical protein
VSINDNATHYIYMLIHIVSIEFQPTMKVNIYNQCLNFKLTYRRSFNSGADLNKHIGWEVDAGSMMSIDFTPILTIFGGALTYMLQGEGVNPGNQSESTRIRLFVAWKSEGYKKFHVFIRLIEHGQTKWNEIKLYEYYQRYANRLSTYTSPIKDTWSINDGTALMTKLELDFTQRDGVLNITITEGVKDDYTKVPELIDPEM